MTAAGRDGALGEWEKRTGDAWLTTWEGHVRIGIVFTGGECLQQSATYQAIVAEGSAEGFAKGYAEGFAKGRLESARRMLIRFGRHFFGKPPGRRAKASIEAINNVELLEELISQAQQVRSWDELLPDMPALKPPSRRRKRR